MTGFATRSRYSRHYRFELRHAFRHFAERHDEMALHASRRAASRITERDADFGRRFRRYNFARLSARQF
jgi:hypothetical protein